MTGGKQFSPSTSNYIENIDLQVWAAARYDIQKYHYIMDFASRGEIEFTNDRIYVADLRESLQNETDKRARSQTQQEINRLTKPNFSIAADDTDMEYQKSKIQMRTLFGSSRPPLPRTKDGGSRGD